jgi:hypothetical protein
MLPLVPAGFASCRSLPRMMSRFCDGMGEGGDAIGTRWPVSSVSENVPGVSHSGGAEFFIA